MIKLKNIRPKSWALVAFIILVSALVIIRACSVNPYNNMGYINVSGKTIGELAEERGITLAELKEEYDLPRNMRADTEESAAYYNIPTEKMAELCGMTFEEFSALYGWDESIGPRTPWGKAQDETQLKYMYQSEKALESFKAQYNLGDDITGETKYKVVRDQVTENNPGLAMIR